MTYRVLFDVLAFTVADIFIINKRLKIELLDPDFPLSL